MVLVNCGAGHFARDLQPASAQNVRYVVVDSHRPVCPKYNDADDIECVLLLDDDDPLSLQQIPPASSLDSITEEGEWQLTPCCVIRFVYARCWRIRAGLHCSAHAGSGFRPASRG